mgnify:FL=1
MKKIFIVILFLMSMIFLIPIIFTRKFKTEETSVNTNIENIENNQNEQQANYEYSKLGTIKLLHSKTGEVENLEMDKYLLGVVSAEMPASFEEEALKAQAIVARTYTAYIILNGSGKHKEADICDDSRCCQAWISKEDRLAKWDEKLKNEYWTKIENAVNSTKGKVITYNGEVIDAFFHSNSGGKTENVSVVWGGADLPYLQSVETAGEDAYSQYASEVELSKQEFENKIKEKYSNFTIDYNAEDAIKILEYTDGNRVKTVKIGNLELSRSRGKNLIRIKVCKF